MSLHCRPPPKLASIDRQPPRCRDVPENKVPCICPDSTAGDTLGVLGAFGTGSAPDHTTPTDSHFRAVFFPDDFPLQVGVLLQRVGVWSSEPTRRGKLRPLSCPQGGLSANEALLIVIILLGSVASTPRDKSPRPQPARLPADGRSRILWNCADGIGIRADLRYSGHPSTLL
jgi:hypothetical protein